MSILYLFLSSFASWQLQRDIPKFFLWHPPQNTNFFPTSIAFKPAESGWGGGQKYANNFDRIFSQKNQKPKEEEESTTNTPSSTKDNNEDPSSTTTIPNNKWMMLPASKWYSQHNSGKYKKNKKKSLTVISRWAVAFSLGRKRKSRSFCFLGGNEMDPHFQFLFFFLVNSPPKKRVQVSFPSSFSIGAVILVLRRCCPSRVVALRHCCSPTSRSSLIIHPPPVHPWGVLQSIRDGIFHAKNLISVPLMAFTTTVERI